MKSHEVTFTMPEQGSVRIKVVANPNAPSPSMGPLRDAHGRFRRREGRDNIVITDQNCGDPIWTVEQT